MTKVGSDHEEHQKELKKLAKFRRARQLAVLHANTTRGALIQKTHLPTDADLYPVGDLLGTSYASQVLPAPSGWGKTTIVAQLEESCNTNGWAVPLIVRCKSLNVRGATFRGAVREVLLALTHALEKPDKRIDKEFLLQVKAVRDQLMALQGRSDIIQKSISTTAEGRSSSAHEDSQESGTRVVNESVAAQSKESSFSFQQAAMTAAAAPFVLAVSVATSAMAGKKSRSSSKTERSETSERRRTSTLRSSAETQGRSETYHEVDDLKDHLDRIREGVRALVLRRQELLGRPTTFFIFDDFDEIPLASQPYVAEFFRLLATSSDGFVKIMGSPHRLNLFLDGASEMAGFRLGRDIHTVDAPNRLLALADWEEWLNERLDWLEKHIPAFHSGAKERGRAEMSPEVLTQLALLSGGRPGVFFSLLARANDLAWEAKENGGRDKLEVTARDIDCAVAAFQRIEVPRLQSAVEESPYVAGLLSFLARCAAAKLGFIEFLQHELDRSEGLREAVEILAECLVMIPVGTRVEENGSWRAIYLLDSRSLVKTALPAPDWSLVRQVATKREWSLLQEKKLTALVTLQKLSASSSAPEGGAKALTGARVDGETIVGKAEG